MKKTEFDKWNRHISKLLEEFEFEAIKEGTNAEDLALFMPHLKRKTIEKVFGGKVSPESWAEAETEFGEGDKTEIPIAPDFQLGKEVEKLKGALQAKDENAKQERWSLGNIVSNISEKVNRIGSEGRYKSLEKRFNELDEKRGKEKQEREEIDGYITTALEKLFRPAPDNPDKELNKENEK